MPALSPLEAVAARFPDALASTHAWRGDATVVLHREHLLAVACFLREDPGLAMDFLMDLSAVDYSTFGKGPASAFFASSGSSVRPSRGIPDGEPWPGPPGAPDAPGPFGTSGSARFVLVYHFFSTRHKHRLRLVVPVDEAEPEADSLTPIWAGANWLEREVWDMFGIVFRGHPDPRRILMYDGFEGHPLRKDYPVNKRQPLIGPLN